MNTLYIYAIIIGLAFVLYWFISAKRRREKYIESYLFSEDLKKALLKNYKEIYIEEILDGLREYFIILNRANNAKFFVPSKAVLTAWRAFILSKEYYLFSKNAFGRMITPPTSSRRIAKKTLKNAFTTVYALATKREGIDLKKQKKLPILFKLDNKLSIKRGTKFRFKQKKAKKSKTRTNVKSYVDDTSADISFSVSYSSDEYWECSIEIGSSMKFTMSNEHSMDEYSDNSSDSSSGSGSSSGSSDSHSSSSDDSGSGD